MAALSAMSLIAGLLSVGGFVTAPAASASADVAEQATTAPLKDVQLRMAPGNPGVPSEPTLIFEEDFENRPAGSNVLVSDYVGVNGTTYVTDAIWGDRVYCNGFIVDSGSARLPGDCVGPPPGDTDTRGATTFGNLLALPFALGEAAGSATPETNAAAASYTAGTGPDNAVQFATESQIPFSEANRFVTFSVDAAATNCHSTHPELRFYLQDDAGTEIAVSNSAIDPCNDPRSTSVTGGRAGTFAADSSVLLTGESFGIVLRNENGNGAGNDGAYDNIRVLDVTPQLDKSFSPTSTFVDGISTLTFTVTNTSELAEKDGWSFTDTLPAGLEVAATPNLGGDCVADRAAEAGGTTIAITNGVLATGEVSCTITVDVTSSQIGSYTNSAGNVTQVGLNSPGEATVEFTDPADVTCVSDTSIFNTATDLNGGSLPVGSRDLNWQVGVGNGSGYQSVTSYEPAYVIEPIAGAWVESPYGNADWISYSASGQHDGNIDLYFRYDFTISELVQLDGFALPMDFYADNSVHEVWVNGVAQSATEESLPQSPANPYFHGGFVEGGQASTRLSQGFEHGENTIIVRVASGAPFVGFLAQILPEPVCADFGDAPESYGTTAAADGARHGVVPGLTLGSEIDADADGQPTAAADGDDVNGVADEDALSDDVVLQPGATSLTVPVAVTNEREASATLYGWIDIDGNGTFDADEAATAVVPGGATSVDLAFTDLAAARDGSLPYMRFRLTTDELVDNPDTPEDERALGVASNGEVEDHRAQVATTVPVSCVAPFVETFGAGAGIGGPLPPGQTTYRYEPTGGGSAGYVQDGEYTIYPGNNPAVGTWWHPGGDHTGDPNGRMMLINADDNTTGIFFQRTFTGLVEGGTYDFSAWITNANRNGSPAVPNVTFRVVDPTTGDELATVDSGNISNKTSLVWEQFGMQFTAETSTVRLELVNNALGGNGNDLAIDDISFAPVCDFGDAPASYGTLNADEGPAHVPGATRLGAEIDFESDGRPTAGADGDDVDGTPNDEDGIDGPIEIATGVTNTVTISATNDSSEDATLAGWIDLDANGTFDEGERVIVSVPANSGTADYTLEFPGADTTEVETYARFRIFGTEIADPQPLGLGLGGEVEDYLVTVLQRDLSVAKSSTFTDDSRPGDTVEYTVTITNTGDTAYTDAVPALVFDDLTGVLDDATFAEGPTAVASDDSEIPDAARVGENHVSWSGPLAVGASVEITYSVTLTGAGDGVVRNVAWQPGTPTGDEVPPTPECAAGGNDPETGEPCATTSGDLPRLTVEKSSDVEDLPADGGVVTYEVTVTNPGPGNYTDAAPAVVTDDLSDVLDDAAFNGIVAPETGASFDEDAQELTWSGALAAGDSVTIEYTVTYDQSTGDNILYNVACVPAAQVAPGTEACAEVSLPGAELAIGKSVDPADGSTVRAGQEVTYTLSFESLGEAPAAVDSVDDLSDVLDDATFVDGSLTVSSTALTATLDGDELAITGEVPVDETITVSYRVLVDAYAEQGNHVLANVVQNPDGTCAPAGCPGTENPIRHLTVEKSATLTEGVLPGDVVEYTVTVTNDGEGDYTAEQPAVVADDMTDVLDDATFNGDAEAVASDDTEIDAPAFEQPTLTWSGPLAAGESVTITYSVTVTNLGDHDLVNTAGAVCAEGELCDPPVEETVLVPHITPAKSADPASGEAVEPGDVVTYTLSWTNDGQAVGPVDATDDLSDVLDDADLTTEPVVAEEFADAVAAVYDAEAQTIRVTGSLQPGETVTVTYQVTVRADGERGNNIAGNVLTPDVPPYVPNPDCDSDDCPPEFPPPTTEHRIPQLEVAKSADPADGATVRAGQEVTYTLELSSTGEAPVTVDQIDDLSDVLDDATFVADSITVSDAAVTAVLDGDQLVMTGEIPADETVTVTYSVIVNAYDEQGDHSLGNVVTNADGSCQPGGCPETEHVVRHLSVTKSATPAEAVLPGDVVEYTVTVTNDGAAAYTADQPAVVADDMTDVLDDATFNGDAEAVASDGSEIAAPAFEDATLTWSGPLAAGESVTITYSVTVTNLGDHDLVNTAGAVCAEGELCDPPVEETVLLPHVTPAKSADPASGETVIAGDVVTYTLTWTNDGQAAGRVDATDDLSAVLDDADLTGEPVVDGDGITAAFDAEAQTIRVEGGIAVDQTVTVTYQVTVRADGERGDNIAGNVLTPDVPPYVPNPDCETDCTPEFPPPTTEHRIPEIVDAKSANPESGAEVEPGRSLVYTLTFENIGEAAGTVNRVDDLTHVLDDADVTVAPAASDDALTVSPIADGRFSVTGTLEAGQVVTVTYAVTVKAAEDLGDTVLSNFLLAPGDETPSVDACETGGEDCTRHTIPNVVDAKSVDAGSGTAVAPGQELTYTLTFQNLGSAPGAVAKVDDLTHVLDDADVTVAPTASDDALTVSEIADGRFSIEGELAAGQTVTVTYTVTVKAVEELGDAQLANFLLTPETPTPEDPSACTEDSEDCTSNGLPRIVDRKSATPESGAEVEPGRELTYTLTFENTGGAAGAVSRVDDLTHVLDDADVTVAPTASDDALTVSEIADGRFSIEGELAAGQTVTVTYAVTVKAADELGDTVLSNFLLDPGAETPPADACESGEDCTTHTIPNVIDAKSVDVESGTAVTSGQELTYTLTFENRGSAPGAVAKVDDLTHVLDDADVTVAPTASDDALTVSEIADGRFSIEGELAAGQTVTVTYAVTVKAAEELGDAQLANFLLTPETPTPEDPSACTEGNEDCTSNAAPRIVDAKSVDPASSTSIRPGQELTYTLAFENTGAAAGAVHRVDDLTHVLDDADVTVAPTASDDALAVSEIADGRFSVTGELAAGQSATVTYTVTVKAADELGDTLLANFLLDPEQETPEAPVCTSGEDCTFNPISNVTVAKAADPASGTEVDPGQELTYTLTFQNEGEGAQAIDYTDHMAGVLDDAELTQAPTASDEALTVSDVTDGSFTIAGELAAGQTVTVTYVVTVRDWADQGDSVIGNVLAVTGQAPPEACDPESTMCTEHGVTEPPVAPTPDLPRTGGDLAAVALFGGLGALLLAGGAYLFARSRREVTE